MFCSFNWGEGRKIKGGEIPLRKSGIFINRCQVPLASRGNEGALSFVPSTMPLEVIWKPEMPFYAVYELYDSLPILCLTAQEWGHQRRRPFDMKSHRTASFKGTIRSDPTHRAQRASPPPRALGCWFPGGGGWLWSSLHCSSPGQPTAATWPWPTHELTMKQEILLPVTIYTLPRLLPLLPGPSEREPRAPLAAEKLKLNLHCLWFWHKQYKQRSFKTHHSVLLSCFLLCTLDIRESSYLSLNSRSCFKMAPSSFWESELKTSAFLIKHESLITLLFNFIIWKTTDPKPSRAP